MLSGLLNLGLAYFTSTGAISSVTMLSQPSGPMGVLPMGTLPCRIHNLLPAGQDCWLTAVWRNVVVMNNVQLLLHLPSRYTFAAVSLG